MCAAVYNELEQQAGCPHLSASNVQPITKKKEHVRIVTEQGYWFDLDKPDDFSMVAFVMSIKANGHLLNERIWQPDDGIATIFVWSEDAPPKQEGTVLQFPKGPVA